MTTASDEPTESVDLEYTFTLILDERISGMEIDITRDEVRRLVEAGRAINTAPGDFIREAVAARVAEILDPEQRTDSPAAGA